MGGDGGGMGGGDREETCQSQLVSNWILTTCQPLRSFQDFAGCNNKYHVFARLK